MSDRDDRQRLVPLPGTDGLVGRFPGSAVFVAGAGGDAATAELLRRCRAAGDAPDAGSALVTEIPAWAAAQHSPPAPFAVVTRTGDGWIAIVHGPVTVTVEGPAGPLVGGGATPGCTVDPLGPDPASIVVTGPGNGAPGAAPTGGVVDLERGVVHGGGFALLFPQAAEAPAAATGEAPRFRSVNLLDDEDEDADAGDPRPPLPVEADPVRSRSAEPEIGQVIVQGVVCPRGHFNDPRARFCSSCAISMANQTSQAVPGPRPPLGVLVFDDGTTYSLSTNYIIGRQPETHPYVAQRLALPLTLQDDQRTISRAHAEIRLEGWDVHFTNLSATNGSFIWDAQYQQWVALAPGQPVVLAPGMRIAMGQRSAVFESALGR